VTRPVLPDAPWRQHSGLVKLVEALGDVRFVGGAVRDTLLGLAVDDVDLATPLRPDDVNLRLESAGIKAVPTGIAHGTITGVADGKPYEITTLRRDVSTDGRHATIAFADDWQEDAARRDFTINALYADPESGDVFDYFGGLDDLKERHVRFIGDAAQRIDEDHLRMLRYFRFFARFGSNKVDDETLAIITSRAPKLRSLSRERIADELMKLLALPDPVPALQLMVGAGLFAHIAPEIGDEAPDRVRFVQSPEARPDPSLRLIALLPPDPVVADGIAAKLKLSNRLRKRLAIARGTGWEDESHSVHALAYRIGIEGALDRAMLNGDGERVRQALEGWTSPQLPIRGGDLIAMGLTEGPAVARALRAVEDQWVAEGFPDAQRTRAIAADLLQAK
jgi:poly(A) polymerase